MKKSLDSRLPVDRRVFITLGILFCLSIFGFVAWQTKAQEGDGKTDPSAGEDAKISRPSPSLADASVLELSGKAELPQTTGHIELTPSDAIRGNEAEPNGTSATATPIDGSAAIISAGVYPAADVDFYSFTGTAGDRVYVATQTLFDASASGDTVVELLAADGTTVLETDNNDGTFNASSSTIAGFPIVTTGPHFLRVRHNLATGTVRPYDLHFRLQSTAPTPEVEPNNTTGTANPMPASGTVSGTVTAVSPGEADFFSITLAAGDSVYIGLDMNPERDANVWNGRLGFGLFGNPPANQIVLANDANAGASALDPNSEAFFFTVKDAGTYFFYVDSIVATGLGANATYNLTATVYPAVAATANCTTYTSTDVPQTIPTGPGQVSSTLTVPGNPRIADLDVAINLNHTFMQDVDIHLVSPAGNDNGLLTDVGSGTAAGPQTLMDVIIDDEAALPQAFGSTASFHVQPELAYRLHWFDGENAGGTWTLVLRDDATGDGGTLNNWSITVCEPPPPPACPAGTVQQTVFSSDFEAGDAGFTHSGAIDEWERGLPATVATTTGVAAFNSCNSGTNCWKTDLDNTYNAGVATGSPQDLLSPNIDLAGLSAPVIVRWAQRYQIENATFDRAFVDHQQVGGATPVRLWEWQDATMTNSVGNPAVSIGESAGWRLYERRADSLAGLNTELRFNLTADNTVQLAGLAIDDVSVTACRSLSADLGITKTDGVSTATPGGSVTYTITASNAGPDPATGATVADTFPASIVGATWTCVGAGGGTCTAAGAGNINDSVNLPTGGSVTYTVNANISSSATGTLSNTATVSSSLTDPDPMNNSATDTDVLTPTADLSITKTDGVVTVIAGGTTTYTIVASNPGPSDAPGSTVTDTFPAAITSANWTCVSTGGGTCTGAGAGNISDVVNLPAGSSVTYTVVANISPSASGTLMNTATVAPSGALSIVVVDPDPMNNSATDTDTIIPVGCEGGGNCTTDLAITKTDGVTQVTPLQNITYTIVASNAGPTGVNGAVVTDNFPTPALTNINWTCVGAGGATCPLGGAGNINALVSLPVGGTATFTATATVAATASFAFSNTGTVTPPTGATDPDLTNNSARDADAVCSPAILAGYSFFNGRIVTFAANNPGTYLTDVQLVGLNPGEVLEGIDFRPANGQIYGVAVEQLNLAPARVVTINPVTGAVTSVGSTIGATGASSFGIDFNPVADRIRETENFDTNRRLNPNDGTLTSTDTNLAYAIGDPNQGANPNVVHVAYTNSVSPAPTTTTLYGIDVDTNSLVTINPPNNGTLNTVGPLGVDPNTNGGGFDIAGGTNTAYAALNLFGFSVLHTINLATGAATAIGDIGVPLGKGGPLIDGLTVINAGGCPTTAAGVTVSGRVFSPEGYGLRNATVSITDPVGVTRTARTSSFGYYTFEGIEVGGTYVVSVGSKSYSFGPRTITVNDAVVDLDFIGTAQE